MKKVYELSSKAALKYFLKNDSYSTLELPAYIDFSVLLKKINCEIDLNNISYTPDNATLMGREINYQVLVSKDGLYSWRRITLINPFYYVYFCKKITSPENWAKIQDKFRTFEKNKSFLCSSIPINKANESNIATTILNWWGDFEQKSISLSLEYEFMFSTDISNFYPSIYTHSFEWVFIEKNKAKEKNKNETNPGKIIDQHIQMMMNNQTNGIPLGSTLMDTFAELILGEIDLRLSEKAQELGIHNYKVVRYRDDYRIFSNSKDDLDKISKQLVFILGEFGLDLNSKKTDLHDDIMYHSIKPAKKDYIAEKSGNSLQKMLYLIYLFSLKHPNSKTTVRYLNDFLGKLFKRKRIINSGSQLEAMLGIISSIMAKNPTTYPVGTAIFVKILCFLFDDDQPKLIKLEQLYSKLSRQPNTEMLEIWFQRVREKINANENITYATALCQRINDELKNKKTFTIDGLWDLDWIPGKSTNKNKAKILSILKKTNIVNVDIFNEMDTDIAPDEVNLFDQEHSA
ncbi:RNA-directed DNA polymerase [Aeromonas jandaei]|uniref:RNA-directed DNA polymerase n=1 Tax=Aeromonas jandaei TaxID=650 RepID=A0A7T4AAC3_AERJA|nr:RNA-directed DNA polymerase [Aeromonas jandaei]QQB20218.1 RNA-directed DNA polymerase [Aeromonas jandaei]UCA34909.1 RNA-directed DNA polymerase [Aeromonas jandaei]